MRVGKGRLELPRLSAHDPKSCSSTNSDTFPGRSPQPSALSLSLSTEGWPLMADRLLYRRATLAVDDGSAAGWPATAVAPTTPAAAWPPCELSLDRAPPAGSTSGYDPGAAHAHVRAMYAVLSTTIT